MVDVTNDPERHGREGALAALKEAAQDPAMQKQHGPAAESFEPEDYEHLIALAWRYQFDDDRSKFKRELRELQEHVSNRILARLELNG
ncbi:hypothetical protein [Actinomadura decatromicini]|uniref:Uncharacterized protein n=1 Tax=Actinomadura decatromicini TaxID=2604572 RepID=A0A5D3FSI7_9ACTN|nr:hypothetical protein [Actinomadura decatromicini]TYK51079.1 hypothetical protein FXF68_11555 [Actinomadura decatromicini]